MSAIQQVWKTALRPNPGAFSLIELLLVIAIIGGAASLLLPSLVRSKASAKRIQCVGNLHQLGMAGHLDRDDNAGNCFRLGGNSTNGGQLYWFGWIAQARKACANSMPPLVPYPQFQARASSFAPPSITRSRNSKPKPRARRMVTVTIGSFPPGQPNPRATSLKSRPPPVRPSLTLPSSTCGRRLLRRRTP